MEEEMRRGGERSKGEMRAYMEHLATLANPPKKVDNEAPILKPETYFRKGRIMDICRRLDYIELDNKILMQKINVIYRSKGRLDMKGPSLLKRSNFYERLGNNKRIETINKEIYESFKYIVTRYSKDEFLKQYEAFKLKLIAKSMYPEIYETDFIDPLDKWTICPDISPRKIQCSPLKRIRCFLDLEVPNFRKLGRIIIEVYKDFVPITAENFIRCCRGEGASYKNTEIFRIVPGVAIFGGDVNNSKGLSTSSSYGPALSKENYLLKFAGPGVVSTFSIYPDSVGTQFLITFKEIKILQGLFVVFGRVVQSLRTLEMLEELGTKTGTPKMNVVVSHCGVLGPRKCPNVK